MDVQQKIFLKMIVFLEFNIQALKIVLQKLILKSKNDLEISAFKLFPN